MHTYKAEIIGKVPYGLTRNDVFATINSILRERLGENVHRVTSVHNSGLVSVIAIFDCESAPKASAEAMYAGTSVTNFSHDVIVREMK